MTAIGKFFLRAQAWQVFFLVVGVYAVGDIALFQSITAASHEPFGTTTQRLPLDIFAAICASIVYFWLWFLGTSLNEIAQPNLRPNARFFALALAVSEVYLIVLFISAPNPRAMKTIAPLAVIGTVCIFYAVRFVARALLLAETGKDPKVHEYIVPFLLLCFLPFGIWVLQPRINQLYAERSNH